ncbi:MAG: hypothetical protein LLG01_16020 [Planctomycetaceae bacterium]|nr:hypothetical protein [Planctomycetaceae bacterium]
MQIKDTIRANANGEFHPDVQLRWYSEADSDSRRNNLLLVQKYMFTRPPAGERKSPTDLLYLIKQAFILPPPENRYVVIATYGHGKSHLALALANFFGKKAESAEITALTKSIRNAYQEQPEAQSYLDFKCGRKRQLVICLDGTLPNDLSQLFLNALRKALNNEPETSDEGFPFWTTGAIQFFQSLSQEERHKADAFLKTNGLGDLPGFVASLVGQSASLYDVARKLCTHLRGVMPDWGGQVSLAQAVEWAADRFCGSEDDKPFSGLLILFDEFSAFIRSYTMRTTPNTPLQDLLNGVYNRKGKVVFVAFGQSDPDATMHSVLQDCPNDHVRSGMLVELQRLPRPFRFHLYTTMESVLDSYLYQETDKLRAAFDAGNAWPAVEDATDDSLQIFAARYEGELHWSSEHFQEIVTFGAFPLHPITTSLLCNIELLESSNPRSVLGFVLNKVTSLADSPVVAGSTPSWVRAVALVDWFERQLADDEWKQYQEALRQKSGDLTSDERQVLKAMLLHVIARMPSKEPSFVKALMHMTGLSESCVKAALNSLSESTVIEHVPAMNKYCFWPLGGGARLLTEHVNRALAGSEMSWGDWGAINQQASELGLPDATVTVNWGHMDDWAAPQRYLPREHATSSNIAELAASCPGCIIWLIAKNDADMNWFASEGAGLLSALGTHPKPVALMQPLMPTPNLINVLRKHVVLRALPAAQITHFGSNIVQTVKEQTIDRIRQETRLLQSRRRYVVPQPYAAAVSANPLCDVPSLMSSLYHLAYSSAPPSFFTAYKKRVPNLKRATMYVCGLLLKNEVYSGKYEGNAVARSLVEKFLLSGPAASWCLLSSDKRIREPQNERIKRAWSVIDQTIVANGAEIGIKAAILKLISLPYGYDENVISLLFCSWYGYHRHDLSLSIGGVQSTVDDLIVAYVDAPRASPQGLLELLLGGNLYIGRKDRQGALKQIAEIVDRCKTLSGQPYSRAEARDAATRLTEFLGDDRNEDAAARAKAEEALRIINDSLREADKYDADVGDIGSQAIRENDVAGIIRLQKKLADVPPSTRVKPDQPAIPRIREQLDNKLSSVVTSLCNENMKLKDIIFYVKQSDKLKAALVPLREYVGLRHQVEEALAALEAGKAELEAKQKDGKIIASLQAMTAEGSLKSLCNKLTSIREAQCCSEEARKVQTTKLSLIEGAINRLNEYLAGLPASLDAIVSESDLAKTQQAIASHKFYFSESTESAQIDSALERCSRIHAFFTDVSRLGVTAFRTRKEYEEVADSLKAMANTYAESMGPRQLSRIEAAEKKLKSHLAKATKEAEEWLKKAQGRLSDTKGLEQLVHDLGNPPEFLSEDNIVALETLIAKAKKAQCQAEADAEARRKDAESVAALKAVQTTGSLIQLRTGLETVKAAECITGDAKALQSSKKLALEKAIDGLLAFVAELPERIRKAANQQEVTKLQTAIVSKAVLFEESPEGKTMASALDQCGRLVRFYQDLTTAVSGSFSTRGQQAAVVARINSIEQEYSDIAGEGQKKQMDAARQKLNVLAGELEKKADAWLSTKQEQAKQKKGLELERLLEELAHPPEFLLENKHQLLSELVVEATKTFENGTVERIVDLFQKLTDVELRTRLLEDLHALVTDGKRN